MSSRPALSAIRGVSHLGGPRRVRSSASTLSGSNLSAINACKERICDENRVGYHCLHTHACKELPQSAERANLPGTSHTLLCFMAADIMLHA